ncbi:opacity protein-like surface antigen [Nitrobacteraceae bacterium AZCC 2161]
MEVCRSSHTSSGRQGGNAWLARASCLALGVLVSCCLPGLALGKDDDDSDEASTKKKSTLPNIYLDLATFYTSVPANTLAIGFRNVTSLPTLSSPASQNVAFNAPLTVDLNDRVSVYGGIGASTTRTDIYSWTSLIVDSWNVGFQADVYEQKGGAIPTVTVQSTLSRSVGSILPTTTITSIVELNYALNEDETKGLLAGTRYVSVSVDSDLAKVNPAIIGYVGGYYQWPSNWKLSGRLGVQSFGGAQIANLTPFKPFTQPIVRLDLDQMDDNDNRLFGVTAEISWTPKPAYQLTLRTPLYAIRN